MRDPARRTNAIVPATRRCWVCERRRSTVGGQITPTRVPHWCCKRCWRRKYLQIADSALALLPPARRFAYLVEGGIDLSKPPRARA